jgi:hypothetical protein
MSRQDKILFFHGIVTEFAGKGIQRLIIPEKVHRLTKSRDSVSKNPFQRIGIGFPTNSIPRPLYA